MKLGKQLWTILYINFPNSYSYIWLIWNILHEWYRSSIGTWAALDTLQIQRIEQIQRTSMEINIEVSSKSGKKVSKQHCTIQTDRALLWQNTARKIAECCSAVLHSRLRNPFWEISGNAQIFIAQIMRVRCFCRFAFSGTSARFRFLSRSAWSFINAPGLCLLNTALSNMRVERLTDNINDR